MPSIFIIASAHLVASRLLIHSTLLFAKQSTNAVAHYDFGTAAAATNSVSLIMRRLKNHFNRLQCRDLRFHIFLLSLLKVIFSPL
jgi:hypothetical protein